MRGLRLKPAPLGNQSIIILKEMKLSDDFLDKWRHILNDIPDKTAIPVECIEKVVIKYERRRQKTINFKTLKKQGLGIEEIETVLAYQLNELGESVYDMELVVDVESVATLIQPETNRILNGL
jgi:hypothetical protein